jgi:Chibby family
MTIFGKKFIRKSAKSREFRLSSVPRLNEDIDNFTLPKQKKDDVQLVTVQNFSEEIIDLQKKNKKLQDENSMLTTKNDILLDMMTAGVNSEEI